MVRLRGTIYNGVKDAERKGKKGARCRVPDDDAWGERAGIRCGFHDTEQ